MKRTIDIAVLATLLLCSGCVNLYTRSPFTDEKIVRTYQSTQTAAAFSYVVMFPQVMSSEHETFMWANLISVPCGFVCFCDVPFEALIDTVLFPCDWWLTSYGDRKLNLQGKSIR